MRISTSSMLAATVALLLLLMVGLTSNMKTEGQREALLSSQAGNNDPSDQQEQATFFQALGGMGELNSEEGVQSHSASRKVRAAEKFKELESQSLLNRAQEEDQQANELVLHAKSLAQMILRKQAMVKIRKWIAAKQKAELKKSLQRTATKETKKIQIEHATSVGKARRSHAEHKKAITTRLEQHFKPPTVEKARAKTTMVDAVHAHHAREQQLSRDFSLPIPDYKKEYKQWEFSKLRRYAREHDMFTRSDFCNSDSVIRSVSRTQLKQFFGKSWQSVPYDLHSLAAITTCLKQLGLEASKDGEFAHGSLRGKSSTIVDCANGNEKACSKLASDPQAMSEMKKLLPSVHHK
ncbi:hypothetical protein GUITHDRAFT_162612 [Guillardia theta CCMP2712]|uniref:Uncharacterized protein n=2 Tax=Guillardia theta TaxID=55529 RepID=L1JH88_GUITC|nr:hypothetical protein GUITHDRAFT_162612 [Guillardia theta CCMP2712]EKX47878.1 hypothetical protein GUITHDRAFT_162612 [Guillardia theta CCMP2712]|mmetsp:Transcript_52603/g.163232  ORF Transcript_52603/g.163232 Transcript_52603/m.163232 type:complete len:351 (+) Transcript_52603:181-1233(+)|eukprot:XP_005834858.1 hypothetical protein GUITHDRAFT_162612 [Guillardia theta CCMP2712]